MSFDASNSGNRVSLIGIDRDLSNGTFNELLLIDDFVWRGISRYGVAESKESCNYVLAKLPYEAAIFCGLTERDNSPPLVFTYGQTIWMDAECFMQLASDPAHGAVDLYNCFEAKNSSQLTSAG